MKTMFSFLLTFVFVFSVATFAQEGEKNVRYGGYARLFSMGDNPYVVDPDNIKLNSAYTSIYSNFLWGDIGGDNGNPTDGYGQFFGFNYAVSKELTLGAILSRNDYMSSYSISSLDPYNLVNLVNNAGATYNVLPLNNNLEVLGSYRFGTSVLGLGVSYASTSNEFNPAVGSDGSASASQFGVNLGFLGKASREVEFDVAVSLSMPSATYEPNDSVTFDASQMIISANARAQIELSKKFSLVPTIDFFTASGSIDVDNESSDLRSHMGFGFGLGLQYKVENLIIAGGPALRYDSYTDAAIDTTYPELSGSSFTLPAWNFGAEWMFNDWLIGRIGYVASNYSSSYEVAASNTTVDEYSSTSFYEGDFRLGVGFRFGGFNLDATVNDDVLRHGFNLVGGGVRTFAYLSASFGF
jgi:hypothetical protein